MKRNEKSSQRHFRDSQCTLDARDVCKTCDVWHSDPCPDCNGRGYHNTACPHLRAAYQLQALAAADVRR
jgi:hypothetical protein